MCLHMPYLYNDAIAREKRKFEEYVLWYMSLSSAKRWAYVNSEWAHDTNLASIERELVGVPMPVVPDERCDPLWKWPDGDYNATCSLPFWVHEDGKVRCTWSGKSVLPRFGSRW